MQELQEAREKGQTTTVGVTEDTIKIFFRFIEEEEIAKQRIIKTKANVNHDDNLPNIYLIPGFEGMFKGVETLGKNLKGNVYCLQYGYGISEESIEDIAGVILEVNK